MNFLRIKQISLFAVLATCTSYYRWSTITEIDSFKQASAVLDAADNDTLVVFDIDETLTLPDIRFQKWFIANEAGKHFWDELVKHKDTQKDPEKYLELIISKIGVKTPNKLVEPITVDIIRKLQAKGVKVIALTDAPVSSYGIDPSVPKLRWQNLNLVEIDFSASFPQETIELSTLTSKKGLHPLYYKGILLTDMVSKGACLVAFLDTIGWTPKKIIFFDDKAKKVESVRDELKKRNIPFQGYIYKGVEKLPHVLDEAVLAEQWKHIKEHDEFISDAEAREILQKTAESLMSIEK